SRVFTFQFHVVTATSSHENKSQVHSANSMELHSLCLQCFSIYQLMVFLLHIQLCPPSPFLPQFCFIILFQCATTLSCYTHLLN
ncbi:hypothetical protein VIGAN_08099000, partial [Vigna angularis var. angularis]